MLGALFALLLFLDQASKIWAVEVLRGTPPRVYLEVFTLTYAENSGGWGSLGADWHPFARRLLLIVAPALVLAFLGYYLIKNESFDWTKGVGYMLILSGGVGNLIDRFRLDYVIDFLYLGYGPIGTNIFNIADMAILFGFALVIFASWGSEEAVKDDSKAPVEPLQSGVESVGSQT